MCKTVKDKAASEDILIDYAVHQQEKNLVRAEKTKLKELVKSENGKSSALATFDFEAMVNLPKSNNADVYYKRSLNCYNLTVYDIGTNQGYCYFWYETVGGKGSSEIASGLHDFLSRMDSQEKEDIYLF